MKYIGTANKKGILNFVEENESVKLELMQTKKGECYFEVELGEHSVDFLKKEKDPRFMLGFMKILAQDIKVEPGKLEMWNKMPFGFNL